MALDAAETAHPELLADLAARSPHEPYRTYLLYPAPRLEATRLRNADLAYAGAADFLADLRLVQDSLAAAGATRQAFGELQQLIWQAETFGFHLASLEIRQHSAVHARALREVAEGGALSAQTAEVLATFRAVALDPGPVRRGCVPPLRGQLHPVGGGHRRRLRTGPARDARAARRRCWTWSRCSRAATT